MEKHRFSVTYSITTETGKEIEARHKAFDICVEQTVEFPYDLITDSFIREEIVGRLEKFKKDRKNRGRFLADISYHEATAGRELTQLLNVLFGSTSIKPGIRIESIHLSHRLNIKHKGPRFGSAGLRKLLKSHHNPFICSAIKPLGLTERELAALAGKYAMGCVDIIKDGHSFSDQPLSPFKKRVAAVSRAIKKASCKTGKNTIYAPNVTADTTHETLARARYAKRAGAKALVISGVLSGLGTVKTLSTDKELKLPILMHPSFMGNFTTHRESGISHYTLYGQIARLAGADISIFPNYGGRFSFSMEDCRHIAEGCRVHMGSMKSALPGPGGGVSLDNIKQMKKFYGNDVVFVISGGLFKHDPDITKSCRLIRKMVDAK